MLKMLKTSEVLTPCNARVSQNNKMDRLLIASCSVTSMPARCFVARELALWGIQRMMTVRMHRKWLPCWFDYRLIKTKISENKQKEGRGLGDGGGDGDQLLSGKKTVDARTGVYIKRKWLSRKNWKTVSKIGIASRVWTKNRNCAPIRRGSAEGKVETNGDLDC